MPPRFQLNVLCLTAQLIVPHIVNAHMIQMSTQQQFPMLHIHDVHNGGQTQDATWQK